MIASVAFKNFKALRGTSLVLSAFNLVIGPNGSGKTSLIQALLRLRSLAKLPLADGVQKPGGPEIEFRFAVPHDAVQVRLGCISENVCDFLHVTPPGAAGWPALQTELRSIRSYLLDHDALAEFAPPAPNSALSLHGENLVGVLAYLQAHQPDAFRALSAELIRLLPEFRQLTVEPREGGVMELVMILNDGSRVTADNLSQGTLYLLGILVLAFDPAPPAVLCIEEIDRGIHPRMLREVRDLLYRLSYPASFGLPRPPTQVIATTHSPYLLDLFRDHPEEIVISQKQGTEAKFERLSDRADLAELMQEGSLGDMWFSGILGGVPEER